MGPQQRVLAGCWLGAAVTNTECEPVTWLTWADWLALTLACIRCHPAPLLLPLMARHSHVAHTLLSHSAPPAAQPPDFYVRNLPPAPAGVEWWEYRPGVPLLPQPAEVLGANYSRCGQAAPLHACMLPCFSQCSVRLDVSRCFSMH